MGRKYIALLRGINVAGRRSVSMAELRRSCEGLGWSDVQTYLRSGNIVFECESDDVAEIRGVLARRLAEDFGVDIGVLIVAAEEFGRIAASNPLWQALGGDERYHHVTLLSESVSEEAFGRLQLPTRPGEEVTHLARGIYLYCPHGYGRTKLNNAYFERQLKLMATTRNWRTVRALEELCR